MKYIQRTAFDKHLANAAPQHFADVYLILAKEEFERKAAVQHLLSCLQGAKKEVPCAIKVWQEESGKATSLHQELQEYSLFQTSKEIMIVQNIDKLKPASKEVMENYLAKPYRNLCLILVGETLLATTNLYKKGEKAGVILDLNHPEKPWEKEQRMTEWLKAYIESNGKKIHSSLSSMLVQQLGADQILLVQEVEKLICYLGDRIEIGIEDARAVCCMVPVENAWQLGETIFRRESARAIQIVKSLLEDGTAPLALTRQIRSQFQTEFHICSHLASGGQPSDITLAFPYLKGNLLSKNIQLAQGYGMHRFKTGLLAIDHTELQLKNSSADPEALIEMLIVKLVMS